MLHCFIIETPFSTTGKPFTWTNGNKQTIHMDRSAVVKFNHIQ